MVVALFGLSLVMILGGIASVVQGFPYVRLESGLAMVISGTTAASAGAVLLGLTTVVTRLKRVERVLRAARVSDVSPPAELPREIATLPSSAAPAVAGAAGLAGLTIGGAGLAAAPNQPAPAQEPYREVEPVLPHLLAPDAPAPVARPRVAPPPPEPVEAAEPALPEAELFASPAAHAEQDEHPSLRSSLDEAAPEEDAASPETTPPEPPAKENPVVGTYASGANTYVMFADGTIQADTPRGRFTFGSLDELKTFVEAGGEIDARGAA